MWSSKWRYFSGKTPGMVIVTQWFSRLQDFKGVCAAIRSESGVSICNLCFHQLIDEVQEWSASSTLCLMLPFRDKFSHFKKTFPVLINSLVRLWPSRFLSSSASVFYQLEKALCWLCPSKERSSVIWLVVKSHSIRRVQCVWLCGFDFFFLNLCGVSGWIRKAGH